MNKRSTNIAQPTLLILFQFMCHLAVPQCPSSIGKLMEEFQEKGNFGYVTSDSTMRCIDNWELKQSRIEGNIIVARSQIALRNIAGAEASIKRVLAEDPNFTPRLSDGSGLFQAIFRRLKLGNGTKVYSVSKSNEAVEEAPATVVLVTEEQVENRGYQSLEELLHDLPGFDISTGRGAAYSNIYQRGFRSNQTDHTLLLIDGVEMNDLSSHNAFISRQYSMTNIKQVEVVYGPISNIYGANAFSGVINVITKDATDELLTSNVGVTALVRGGSWNTYSADVTGLYKSEFLSASLSGRTFVSDEMDHGDNANWIFNSDNSSQYEASLTERDPSLVSQIVATGATDFYNTENGALVPSELAVDRARQFDSQVRPVPSYQNASKNLSLNGKLRLANFSMGFQTWKKTEGNIGWNNWQVAGTDLENNWIVSNASVYLKYEQKNLLPKDNLDLSLFTRFKSHKVLPETRTIRFKSYLGAQRNLLDLINGLESKWDTTSYYRVSNQLRVELRGNYDLQWDLKDARIMFGSELRNSQVQGDYITALNDLNFTEISDSLQSQGNYFNYHDLGFFGESVFGGSALKLILGGRLDFNNAGISGGFGSVANVRSSLIYKAQENIVFKAIYSTAFKDASPFNRYSESANRIANPSLEPERIRNLEGAIFYRLSGTTKVEASVYTASVVNMIGLVAIGEDSTQNRSIGQAQISGAQLSVESAVTDRLQVFGNYSYLNPKRTNVDGEMRIGDMASHRMNLGANWRATSDLNVNLRINLVGKRRTGIGTSVPTNPNAFVKAYQVLNSTISYRLKSQQNFKFQLILNNLLDQRYNHPGVRTAGDGNFAALLPQNGRNIHLLLSYDFGS